MHGNMVQPSARSLETPPSAAREVNLCSSDPNNNGKARACGAKICGNAANESTSLLDDLRFNAESTTYAGRKK
jgi:hypothetical protein